MPKNKEILASNFMKNSCVNGKLLYLPPVGAVIGEEDWLTICVWEYDVEAFQNFYSEDLPPLDDWYSPEIVRCQLSSKSNSGDEFWRVHSHAKQIGDSVQEFEVVGMLVEIDPPTNFEDWHPTGDANSKYEIGNETRLQRFASHLEVDLSKVAPRSEHQPISEWEIFKCWREKNGLPDY